MPKARNLAQLATLKFKSNTAQVLGPNEGGCSIAAETSVLLTRSSSRCNVSRHIAVGFTGVHLIGSSSKDLRSLFDINVAQFSRVEKHWIFSGQARTFASALAKTILCAFHTLFCIYLILFTNWSSEFTSLNWSATIWGLIAHSKVHTELLTVRKRY